VFVMCCARSGSTLLRFILDEHPELSCPPETCIPALYSTLASVVSVLSGTKFDGIEKQTVSSVPESVLFQIRAVSDLLIGDHLKLSGKSRYCDKSLGTARFAELITAVHPNAAFIALHRHPMDFIASALEACPWGVRGYGFDPYMDDTPGNAILALARYWVDLTTLALAFESAHPESCYRIRYEDLTDNPETEAKKLFAYLGMSEIDGVTKTCFSRDRQRFGAGDHKIWRTNEVTSSSVGRGWSIPAGMILPDVLEKINELTEQLGYVPVDDDWGITAPPADIRLQGENSQFTEVGNNSIRDSAYESAWLGERLRLGTITRSEEKQRWAEIASEKFCVIAIGDRRLAEAWLVDLAVGTVTAAAAEQQAQSDWDVIASADVWKRVVNRSLNLNTAIRSCHLRYSDSGDPSPAVVDARLDLLSNFLGITTW
jgi:protein-tyrosine sulfotransferase